MKQLESHKFKYCIYVWDLLRTETTTLSPFHGPNGNVILGGAAQQVSINVPLNTNGNEIKECIRISGTTDTLAIVNDNTTNGGNITLQASAAHGAVSAGMVYINSILDLNAPINYSYTSLSPPTSTQVGFSAGIVYTNSIGTTTFNVLPPGKSQLGAFGIPSAGVWYIQFNYVIQANSESLYGTTTLFLENADQTTQYAGLGHNYYYSNGGQYISLNACIPISGATTLYVRGYDTSLSTYVSANGYYTRIA